MELAASAHFEGAGAVRGQAGASSSGPGAWSDHAEGTPRGESLRKGPSTAPAHHSQGSAPLCCALWGWEQESGRGSSAAAKQRQQPPKPCVPTAVQGLRGARRTPGSFAARGAASGALCGNESDLHRHTRVCTPPLLVSPPKLCLAGRRHRLSARLSHAVALTGVLALPALGMGSGIAWHWGCWDTVGQHPGARLGPAPRGARSHCDARSVTSEGSVSCLSTHAAGTVSPLRGMALVGRRQRSAAQTGAPPASLAHPSAPQHALTPLSTHSPEPARLSHSPGPLRRARSRRALFRQQRAPVGSVGTAWSPGGSAMPAPERSLPGPRSPSPDQRRLHQVPGASASPAPPCIRHGPRLPSGPPRCRTHRYHRSFPGSIRRMLSRAAPGGGCPGPVVSLTCPAEPQPPPRPGTGPQAHIRASGRCRLGKSKQKRSSAGPGCRD